MIFIFSMVRILKSNKISLIKIIKKFYLLEFKAKNKNQEWTSRFKIFRNTIRDIIDENAEYYIATIGTLNLNYSKLQISPLLPNALKIKLIPK